MSSLARLAALAALLSGAPLMAQPGDGAPVFGFAHTVPVESDMPIPPDAQFRVAFDVSAAATPGEMNRTFNSAARFINMHVAAGVPLARIHVAIVVHGPASWDVVRDDVYRARRDGKANGSADAVAQLLGHGVDIYLCGQAAAGQGIAKADLIPGVKMALSAMTAHALLQQQGYTLNPF